MFLINVRADQSCSALNQVGCKPALALLHVFNLNVDMTIIIIMQRTIDKLLPEQLLKDKLLDAKT